MSKSKKGVKRAPQKENCSGFTSLSQVQWVTHPGVVLLSNSNFNGLATMYKLWLKIWGTDLEEEMRSENLIDTSDSFEHLLWITYASPHIHSSLHFYQFLYLIGVRFCSYISPLLVFGIHNSANFPKYSASQIIKARNSSTKHFSTHI